MAKEPPQKVRLAGRIGFNQEMCGVYSISAKLWQGKCFYVNRRNHWVIRWEPSKGLWIVDWRGLKNDTISAAFVREDVDHPGLITKLWKVYSGSNFELDPHVRILEELEDQFLLTPQKNYVNRYRKRTASHGVKRTSLSSSSAWDSETTERFHFNSISSFRSSYSRSSAVKHLEVEENIEPIREDAVEDAYEREDNEKLPKVDTGGGGWLDEHGFLIEEDLTLNHEESIKRSDKWRAMLFGRKGTLVLETADERIQQRCDLWENKLLKHPKLKSRIRKGIPGEFRSEVWVHITGARKIRLQNPRIYPSYLNNFKPCEDEDQIWKDIKRAFRGHDVYKNINLDSPAQQALYRVLTIYTHHHCDVGYNQGISFVAAMLLIYLEEEDVFWTLHVLTRSEKFAMAGVWADHMPAIHLRYFQMESLCKRHCSYLQNKLDKLEITADMYKATQWFVTVFLATDISFGVILRIWDIYLNEGLKFIFRVGLVLLEIVQEKLQESPNSDDAIWDCLQNISKNIDETVIDRAVKIRVRTKDLENMEKLFETGDI